MFPSNFARKVSFPSCRPVPIDSSGPCSNPSLRSSRVAAACAHFARWKSGGRPPSWIEGWDAVKREYAAMIACGSGVGVGGANENVF